MTEEIVDRNKVYAVRFRENEEATDIALYAEMGYRGFEGICYLSPPERGHMIEGKLGKKTKTGFIFIAPQWRTPEIEFIEITYENFKNEFYKVVSHPEEVLAQVSNTQELIDYYHRTFPM